MEVERKMNRGMIWSARTSPRFGTTRRVASLKAASIRRTPNQAAAENELALDGEMKSG
jgi:hypothetical protein